MTIQDSTISGNTALGGDLDGGHGGGIYGNNNTITNSTITGNSALRGGGVAGGCNIAYTTFSNNSASQGGGALYLTSTLELGNTILKAGASGVNIFNNGGSFITHGYNISSDDGSGFLNGPGDQINTDPSPATIKYMPLPCLPLLRRPASLQRQQPPLRQQQRQRQSQHLR
jgi:predicted outer membrane repeat protein